MAGLMLKEKEQSFSPNYEPKESDFELTLMEIEYPEKFVTLNINIF